MHPECLCSMHFFARLCYASFVKLMDFFLSLIIADIFATPFGGCWQCNYICSRLVFQLQRRPFSAAKHLSVCNLLAGAECRSFKINSFSYWRTLLCTEALLNDVRRNSISCRMKPIKTAIAVTGTVVFNAEKSTVYWNERLDVSVKCLVCVLHNVTM